MVCGVGVVVVWFEIFRLNIVEIWDQKTDLQGLDKGDLIMLDEADIEKVGLV